MTLVSDRKTSAQTVRTTVRNKARGCVRRTAQWRGGVSRSASTVRIGKTHMLAGWVMGELLDDRGEVIVVLPIRNTPDEWWL